MKIVLLGYRCSGKTLAGREVAHRLGIKFMDTDALVEERAGKSVANIFAQDGEDAFRAFERRAVAELRGMNEGVVAAGGGAVLDKDNVAALKHEAKVIWLETSPDELTRRAQAEADKGTRRPPLTNLPLHQEVAQVLGERRRHYIEAADCIISTDGCTPDEVADRIMNYLELLGIIIPPEKSTGT